MSFKFLEAFYRIRREQLIDVEFEKSDGSICPLTEIFGHSEWAVLSVLCNRASDEGECWPGYGRIAGDCFMSRRQVIRSVGALLLIDVLKKQGGRKSNTYIVDFKMLVGLGGGALEKKRPKYFDREKETSQQLTATRQQPSSTSKMMTTNSHETT